MAESRSDWMNKFKISSKADNSLILSIKLPNRLMRVQPNTTQLSSRDVFHGEFGFSGSERRRQPERMQTCYEDHNAVRINALIWDLFNRGEIL